MTGRDTAGSTTQLASRVEPPSTLQRPGQRLSDPVAPPQAQPGPGATPLEGRWIFARPGPVSFGYVFSNGKYFYCERNGAHALIENVATCIKALPRGDPAVQMPHMILTGSSENLLSALCLRPERVLFLGTQSLMTDGRIAALRSFFMLC